MIKVTSDCDPSLNAPNIKYLKKIVNNIFVTKKIKEAELSYVFCDDAFLSKLKQEFFNKNHFTDVIAFRLNSSKETKIEGEIYISLPRAKENSTIFNEPYEKEVARLIIHGCLHLIGYLDKTKNQKKEMNKQEKMFLDNLLWFNLFENYE